MEHDLRKQIILKLIHKPRASYSDLWEKQVESNMFAYHLKKLEDEGLVQKYDDGYGLTLEGKKLSAFIEGDTGGKAEMPTPVVILLVREGNKVLCQQRLKEPFYGYWGLPSGKINFGWNPKECAIRDLKEETDFVAEDVVLREIEFVKSTDDGVLVHHHMLFTYEVTKYSGTLKERTHKAFNKFMTLEELGASKCFPGDWATKYFQPSDKLKIFEKERVMHNGNIVEVKLFSQDSYRQI